MTLGCCKRVKGTRTTVDKLYTEYDENIKPWKESIQVIYMYFFQQMLKSNFSMNQYKPNLNSVETNLSYIANPLTQVNTF